MKKIYRIQMMDYTSYYNYMGGSNNYGVDYYDVEAESKEQALAIAKQDNPDYFLNTNFVREVEEKKYTTNHKDRLIELIAQLEEQLANAKADLKKFENRG